MRGRLRATVLAGLLGALGLGTPAAALSVPDEFWSDQQELIVEAAATGRVVVVFPDELPDWAHGSPAVMAERIDAETPGDVPVLVWAGAEELPAYGVSRGTRDARCAAEAAEMVPGTPESVFASLASVIADGEGCAVMEDQLVARWNELGAVRPDTGNRDDAPVSRTTRITRIAAATIIGFLLLGLGVAVWRRWRVGRSERRRSAVLAANVTGADVIRAREAAEAALQDLGDALDHAEMREGDALSFWALALDEYEQATRLADSPTRGMRDDVRIRELCGHGRRHLSEATRGRVRALP